jgi:hypothetical protein
MPQQKVPIRIFCRAAQTQRRWSDDGELVPDDGDEDFVPPYVVALFMAHFLALRRSVRNNILQELGHLS